MVRKLVLGVSIAVLVALFSACGGAGGPANANMTGTWIYKMQGIMLYRLVLDDNGGIITGDAYLGAAGPLDALGQRNRSSVQIGIGSFGAQAMQFEGTVSGGTFYAGVFPCTPNCEKTQSATFVRQ